MFVARTHTNTHIARIIGVTSFLPSFRSFGRNSRKYTHTLVERTHGRKKVLGHGTSRPPTYLNTTRTACLTTVEEAGVRCLIHDRITKVLLHTLYTKIIYTERLFYHEQGQAIFYEKL